MYRPHAMKAEYRDLPKVPMASTVPMASEIPKESMFSEVYSCLYCYCCYHLYLPESMHQGYVQQPRQDDLSDGDQYCLRYPNLPVAVYCAAEVCYPADVGHYTAVCCMTDGPAYVGDSCDSCDDGGCNSGYSSGCDSTKSYNPNPNNKDYSNHNTSYSYNDMDWSNSRMDRSNHSTSCTKELPLHPTNQTSKSHT